MMSQKIVRILVIFLILIILDMIWFTFSLEHIYKPLFRNIQKTELNLKIIGGIIAWLLIALAINEFVINDLDNDLNNIAFRGALIGFIIYGVYNATNYATFSDYAMSAAIIDTTWGTIVCLTTSVIMATILKNKIII